MVYVPTQGLWVPSPSSLANGFSAAAVLNATGQKVAHCGPMWNKDRAAKNVSKVGIFFGASITKAGGSALTLSLQDVDLATGPPIRPDEIQDQTCAIPNTSIAANTWLQCTLSASRTVQFGEMLAVVIEFDGSGRLGSDSILIGSFLSFDFYGIPNGNNASVLKSGGAWGVLGGSGRTPIVVLEFDDGTFGTIGFGQPISNIVNGSSYHVNSVSFDEMANEFSVPFACKCDGAWASVTCVAAGSNFEFRLYDASNNLIASQSVDGNVAGSVPNANFNIFAVDWPDVTLTPGQTYRLAIAPTTTNTIQVNYVEVANAAYWQALRGGLASCSYTQRVNAGAWAPATTTRRLSAGIRISALSDSAGAGGGLLVNPVLRGGMI